MNKKYKLLIADDEYWVRKKLAAMLDWEALGIECLEPAKDGQETLERVRQERPDILITDVNMPFINGVELLRRLQPEFPELVSFVVSGYDDFEYVKGCFLGGCVNYLLKPVSRDDMEQAMGRALEIISAREDAGRKVKKAASLLRDTEFSQLVRDRETSALPTASMQQYLGMNNMALMLIKIHNLQTVSRSYDHDLAQFSYELKAKIIQLSRIDELIVFNHIYRPGEFMIITDMPEHERLELAGKILDLASQWSNAWITVSMTANSFSVDQINRAYKLTVAGLLSRKFQMSSEIINAVETLPTDSSVKLGSEHAKQLKKLLDSGNRQAVIRLLLEDSGLAHCTGWRYSQVLQLVKETGLLLNDFALKNRSEKFTADMEGLTENCIKAVETLSLENISAAVRAAVDYLCPSHTDYAPDTTRHLVRQAVAYVDKNYFEDISLSALSEKFNVESSYFSRIFRKETGENLTYYITRKRIEKACALIENGDINLTEIAFMVGYNDYTYFNRVFKKYTGKSPREYRSQFNTQEGKNEPVAWA